MKHSAAVVLLALSLITLFSVKCVTPPSDPDDPMNVVVSLFLPDSDNEVTAGNQKQIGLEVSYPEYIDHYNLRSSCGDVDTEFTFLSEALKDTLYLSPLFLNEGKCMLSVMATMQDNRINEKADSVIVRVLAGEPSLSFNTVPTAFTTHTGRTDTLHFALASNNIDAIDYTLTGDTDVDTTEIRLIEVTNDDSILVHFNPQTPGDYSVTLTATGPDGLYATASVPITVLASLSPTEPDNPHTLITGTKDTLVYTLTPEQVENGITMELIDAENLPADIAGVIPSAADSILIAVNSTEEGELSFSIATTNGEFSDTATYTFSFVDRNNAVWAITSATVDAVEGRRCSVELLPYLFEEVFVEAIAPTATLGSFNDSGAWYYTPPWGSEATVAVTITGKRGEISQDFSLTLNVAPGDEEAPEITLLSPATASKTVSSSQATVSVIVKDAGAGVDKVTFTTAEETLEGTPDDDSTYSAVITGLPEGTATDVVITATDNSMKKNNSSKTISLTYDPTMEDEDAPVFSRTDGPQSGNRVTAATGSITCDISDDSGVDSVWWLLNDAFVAAVSGSDGEYTINFELTDFGENTISLYAKDGSNSGNVGSKTIMLDYNTEVTAVTPDEPQDGATDVSLTPSFAWTGGTDADGDSVFYRVEYGTSATELSHSTVILTADIITLGTGQELEPITTYYWKVIAWSKAFPDTVQSDVVSFTTEGALPTISSPPQSQEVEEGESVTFSVTADANGFGTLSYQWLENDLEITGAVNDSYTIASPTTDMSGNTYKCVIKNGVGEVTGDAATLTVTAIPTYTVSFYTKHGSAPADQEITRGGYASKPSTSEEPVQNGYEFIDWYMENAGSHFDFDGSPITADLQLVAGWDTTYYDITYNNLDGVQGNNPEKYRITDATISLNAPAVRNGYTFGGWYSDAGFNGRVYSIPNGSTGEKVFWAKWEPVSYTITYNFNGGTSGSNPTSYTIESNVNFDDASKTAYVFDGWYSNSEFSGSPVTSIPIGSTGNRELWAKWVIQDIDGNEYTEVTIGDQVWMVENLRVTHFNDGASISALHDSASWVNVNNLGYCWPENNSSNVEEYGLLYNWSVEFNRLAPEGWRVARKSDYETLIDGLGGIYSQVGGMLKEVGTELIRPEFVDTQLTNLSLFFQEVCLWGQPEENMIQNLRGSQFALRQNPV